MEQSRILVVDDDKEIREIIRVLLTQEGYDVSEARNGREALEYMNDHIDLYILDIMMPYMEDMSCVNRFVNIVMHQFCFLQRKVHRKIKRRASLKGRMIILPNRFPTRNYWCV